MDGAEILRWLMQQCQANLACADSARKFLLQNDVTSEGVWSAYRVGIGDPTAPEKLDQASQQRLRSMGFIRKNKKFILSGNGIVIPTFDPREPQQPVGFVRVVEGQNKHWFAGKVAGVACAVDVDASERIIITANPLLGLKLAQFGCQGVIVAEEAGVLPPYKEWLAGKDIVLAAYKPYTLDELQKAIEPLKTNYCQVQTILSQTSAESLRLLGLKRDELRTPEPVPPITSFLLRDLHKFSREQIASGSGHDVLKSYSADVPELVEVFQVGYLPSDFRAALSQEQRRALLGRDIAGCLILPAFDRAGAIMDFLAVHSQESCKGVTSGLNERVEGLIAPHMATAHDNLYITDSFSMLARLYHHESRNALILRSADDAAHNAERLFTSGVRSARVLCRREAVKIATALQRVGIVVERLKFPVKIATFHPATAKIAPLNHTQEDDAVQPDTARPEAVPQNVALNPAPKSEAQNLSPLNYPSKPELVSHDQKTERATFKSGDALYTVEIRLDDGIKTAVRIEREGKVHHDTFNLKSEPQRKRFSASAALRVSVPFETIEENLIHILDEVQRLRDELLNPPEADSTVSISQTERAAALEFLKSPDLLDQIAEHVTALGIAGEENNKRLLYLIAISRKLPTPLSGVLLSPSGTGKSALIENISLVTATEDLFHFSRLTDTALYHHSRNSLRHKLIIVDEADALTPEVLVALRVLQSRGALTQSYVVRDSLSGAVQTEFAETRGPVAVLTSTAGEMEEQALSRAFLISVDDSPEQTQRVMETQRRLRCDPECAGAEGHRAKLIKLHHNLQRLLEARAVLIPYADRIEFPSYSTKHRRAHEKFLNLISAMALLHQHQRLKQKNSAGEEFIIADERDFNVALQLIGQLVERDTAEFSPGAKEVLGLILKQTRSTFTLDDLKALRPDCTRHRFRAGIDELLRLEVLISVRRNRPRQYHLNKGAVGLLAPATVRLRPARAFGDLAGIGDGTFAKTNPNAATG